MTQCVGLIAKFRQLGFTKTFFLFFYVLRVLTF